MTSSLTPMVKADLILYRAYLPEDENFLYVHWLRGLRADNPLFHLIDREIYFQNYRKVISFLLQNSTIQMACLKESPDVIIGFSVFDKDRLHWVYVKEDWRGIGIGKDLLPKPFHSYSHITTLAHEILRKKFKKDEVVFNPFLTSSLGRESKEPS